jgi:hypothetical protein
VDVSRIGRCYMCETPTQTSASSRRNWYCVCDGCSARWNLPVQDDADDERTPTSPIEPFAYNLDLGELP